MMNKKRTRTAGRLKYALFVPLAAVLLLASNISCVSEDRIENAESTDSRATEKQIFQIVEEMPDFPGGMAKCMMWLKQNIKYPEEAIEKGIQGRVIVQMVIESDGTITNTNVVRSVHPLLDEEALRVINLSPKWKPGKEKGQAVRVKFTIPISFKL